jgi:hypothetical protein
VPIASETTGQCGSNGATCAGCTGTQTCQAGTCAAPPCLPSNCAGCCSNGTCIPVALQSSGQCGTGAAACVACNTNFTCQSGSCLPVVCTANQCRQADQSCATASNATCGQGGAPCVDCTQNALAIYCGETSHTCVTSGLGLLGTPCGSDVNCIPGTNSGSPYCRGLPQGYCADVCDTAGSQIGSCPLNSCLALARMDGGSDFAGICVKSCFSHDAGECGHPAGSYICDTTGLVPHCMPACSQPSDCQGWFGNSQLSCIPATQQCCGTKGFACCGGTCFDGTGCVFGVCS